MKAIVVHRQDGKPLLSWEEVPDVNYGADEVLLEVKATAVNRADLSQARGNYPPPPGVTDVLGLEAAGVVAAVGSEAQGWQLGDRACALLPGGGYAEQVAVPAEMLLRVPDDWSFEQAAAIPEVWLTAMVNLFNEGRLQGGESVLIHAGGSGVGTAAIQLAHHEGARVFITAGTDQKLARGHQLGAELAVNYKKEDFAEKVLAASGGKGVDLILDPVGADYVARNLRVLASGGRLVQIGLLSGRKAEIDLGLVLGKSLSIKGSRLRPRPVAEKIAITDQFRTRFWPLLQKGVLKPIIDAVFPLPDAGEAHEYVRQNRNIGKVILRRN
ncbi:MAG TPA: NAD(P)H-quinone oxidoreductase [Candidatus Sulfomarinibacteraceae bacterium]|nr:NAD(P)H-quinone oxidoreductase [Candidatus Sulfomarinibacteraceae bacterium]